MPSVTEMLPFTGILDSVTNCCEVPAAAVIVATWVKSAIMRPGPKSWLMMALEPTLLGATAFCQLALLNQVPWLFTFHCP